MTKYRADSASRLWNALVVAGLLELDMKDREIAQLRAVLEQVQWAKARRRLGRTRAGHWTRIQ